jgi:protein O-GlcNAc transferase
MDSRQLIQSALGLHQQGRLDQAAEIYAQVLQQEPGNFAALQLMGALRGQQGRNVEALKLLEAALEQQPGDFGALANYGQALMASGRHQDALGIFDRALTAKADFFEALYNKGVALAQLKRFAEAVSSYDKALALRPGSVECLYNRGISLTALEWLDDALASYDAALSRNPNFAPALGNRGNVLRALGRPVEALESYDKTLASAPNDVHALYNRGIALSELRRFEEASTSFRKALALQPNFPDALFNHGLTLLKLERFGEALEDFDKLLVLKPSDVEGLNNRGVALWHLGWLPESLAAYDEALAGNPGHVATLLNRAFLLQDMTRFEEALGTYDKAIAIDPKKPGAWNGRGSVLHALKREREALTSFDQAVALDPAYADALANRAHLRWSQNGDFAGATSDLQAALAADPDQPYARGELLHLKSYGADWEGFEPEKARIDEAVRNGRRVVRPFVYQALSHSPADLQACSRIFAASLFPARARPAQAFHHGHDRIRIGYVSGEFREQATAYLMAGLYELHDRERFEIIAIDNGGGDGSDMRRRLEAAFDKIIYINKLSDTEAAARIRAEEIDILVNLNGYFGAPRMGVFAQRAAPIQVNYLGFPATLGARYMDYILADRAVIPEDERDFYDEQVVYLPHSYQANDRKRPIAGDVSGRAALDLPGNGFVFCNFNQSYKITPSTFASWMRILRAVDGSVLWLLQGKPPFEPNLRRAAEQHGVAPSRLIFAPSLPPDRHLARLKQADLFLDSLPYNAHTTASDALWAGLPLLTCRGTTFPGRVAASLLGAIGMPELIAETMDDYESRAVQLARNDVAMRELKQKLAQNRLTYPLFDTDLFRRNIEAAYTAMWRGWKNGEAPQGFNVGRQG